MTTPFETFVQTELPQRAVMLSSENTEGYTGNPNGAVLSKITNAPKGTWFVDDDSGTLWQKLTQSDPHSWVKRSVNRYFGQGLTGDIDGTNAEFTTNAYYTHDGYVNPAVYLNGIRLLEGGGNDYTCSESVPSHGYDTITFTSAPKAGDILMVDYTLAIVV